MAATMFLTRGKEKPLVIFIKVAGESRQLFIFPDMESINKAIKWCEKKKLSSCEAANALIAHCKKQGVKQIGRKLPKRFLEFAGIKCFKVEAENLTPKKGG